MKRFICIIIFLLMISPTLCLSVLAAEETMPLPAKPSENGVELYEYDFPLETELPVTTKYALLYNASEGRYLYKKNENIIIEPASTVKLMLGIVAFELYKDRLDEEIKITKELLEDKAGLSIYLEPGEVLTIRQLLYTVLMYGANDSAVILAHLYTGNITDFVLKMNEKAKQLGCTDTTYRNVSGLHADGATTTLEDIIKIAVYAEGIEGLTEMTSTDRYRISATASTKARTIFSRNCLVSAYTDNRYKTAGVSGLNYGSTDEMGGCLAVSAELEGKKYFIALMGGTESEPDEAGQTDKSVFPDAVYLLNYAVTAFDYLDILDEKKIISEIPVMYNSTTDYVSLIPVSSVTLFLPASCDIEREITFKTVTYAEKLKAPVSEGQIAGEIILYYNNTKLCKVKLKTTASVSQSKILYVLDQIKEFVLSVKFLVSVGVFIFLLAAYVLIGAAYRGKKKRRRRKLR